MAFSDNDKAMKKVMCHFIGSLLLFPAVSAYALSVASPDASFIYAYDKNGDNKLSLKEFLSIDPSSTGSLVLTFPISRDSFRKLDRNRNGYLDVRDRLEGIGYSESMNCYISNWPRSEQPGVCPD